jgi:hypothetical protein
MHHDPEGTMPFAGCPESDSQSKQNFSPVMTMGYPVFLKIFQYYLDRIDTHEEDGQKTTTGQLLIDVLCPPRASQSSSILLCF